MRFVVWLAMVALACGPTAAQVKAAKDASYAVSVQDVYAVAEQEAARSYAIGERLPLEGVFGTVPQWFTDSGRPSRAPDDEQRKAGNMQVTFVVLVFDDGTGTKVTVQASAVDYVAGSKPSAHELVEGDAKFPAWITLRADKLRVAIHDRVQALLNQRGRSRPR